jgi:DNA-binding MarR family transcriptional regulator
VQPSLQVYENSIKVVLPKVNAKRDFRETSESYVRAGLKENENRILQLLEKKKAMNRQEIERALGLKRTQTGDLLKRLREMNLVTKVGSGAYVKYQLRSNR